MTDPAAPAPIEAIIAAVKKDIKYLTTEWHEPALRSLIRHVPALLDHIDRLTETHQSDRLKLRVLFDEIDRLRAALAAAGGPVEYTAIRKAISDNLRLTHNIANERVWIDEGSIAAATRAVIALGAAGGPMVVTEEAVEALALYLCPDGPNQPVVLGKDATGAHTVVLERRIDQWRVAARRYLEIALPHLRPAVLPSEEGLIDLLKANLRISYMQDGGAYQDMAGLERAARAILALFHSRIGAGSEATHQHVVRGTKYTELGRGTFQGPVGIQEGDRIVAYRDESGAWHFRGEAMFDDGRFKPLDLRITKEWFESKIGLEDGSDIGAGSEGGERG